MKFTAPLCKVCNKLTKLVESKFNDEFTCGKHYRIHYDPAGDWETKMIGIYRIDQRPKWIVISVNGKTVFYLNGKTKDIPNFKKPKEIENWIILA